MGGTGAGGKIGVEVGVRIGTGAATRAGSDVGAVGRAGIAAAGFEAEENVWSDVGSGDWDSA